MDEVDAVKDFIDNAKVTIRMMFAFTENFSIGETYEVEKEHKDPIKDAMQLVQEQWPSKWEMYHAPILLVMGDPTLILEYLKGKPDLIDTDIIDIIEVVLKLIGMNAEKFKEMTKNEQDLRDYMGLITNYLCKPLTKYIADMLEKQAEADKVNSKNLP
jgi:hypothetical protein